MARAVQEVTAAAPVWTSRRLLATAPRFDAATDRYRSDLTTMATAAVIREAHEQDVDVTGAPEVTRETHYGALYVVVRAHGVRRIQSTGRPRPMG